MTNLDGIRLPADDIRLALGRLAAKGDRKDAEEVFKHIERLCARNEKLEKVVKAAKNLKENIVDIPFIFNLKLANSFKCLLFAGFLFSHKYSQNW